jgi:hypothetical protein
MDVAGELMADQRDLPSHRAERLTAQRRVARGPDRAILAVDLAPGKRARSRVNHDWVVLGRRVFTGLASCIEQITAEAAARAGCAGLVLVCEPAAAHWRKQPPLESPETC